MQRLCQMTGFQCLCGLGAPLSPNLCLDFRWTPSGRRRTLAVPSVASLALSMSRCRNLWAYCSSSPMCCIMIWLVEKHDWRRRIHKSIIIHNPGLWVAQSYWHAFLVGDSKRLSAPGTFRWKTLSANSFGWFSFPYNFSSFVLLTQAHLLNIADQPHDAACQGISSTNYIYIYI